MNEQNTLETSRRPKPYRFSTREVLRLLSERKVSGQLLLINRSYLHGIQERSEYSREKERRETEMFRKHGKNYLLSCPIVAVPILVGASSIMLAVVDGHHRLRYSGRYNIHVIPTVVIPVEQAAAIADVSQEELSRRLKNDSSLATGSFRTLTEEKQPRLITNVSNPEELPSVFNSFKLESSTDCIE